jgi:hypothetical protein
MSDYKMVSDARHPRSRYPLFSQADSTPIKVWYRVAYTTDRIRPD